ncbi:MAG: hypothetical protein ACRC4W_03540 [Treponemataceae bacterium]
MEKISEEVREDFNQKTASYRDTISQISIKEKNTLVTLHSNPPNAAKIKFELTEDMLYMTSLYIIISNLSCEMLDVRNEDCLNEARKTLYRAVIYMEEIVSNYIDVPFSDYEKQLASLSHVSVASRYSFVQKFGLAIELLISAYGNNTKWKWSFTELQGRFAVIAKNLLDLVQASKDFFNMQSANHEVTTQYFHLLKKLFPLVIDGYHNRYKFSSKSSDDLRLSGLLCAAYRRILLVFNQVEEADEYNKKSHFFFDRV